ncbi:MAG: class I SAM-dependent methyltransferase [Hyphomicrobiaceae bacterium]|nr:class I SAM-dependent methyltransferase [Hyphomicrobiaceae bacterium]
MSGFDPAWLALREPADHRARNKELAAALAARFALRDKVSVVDLGCGSGSNLRAMAELLPPVQSWTLVDYDAALLSAAREALKSWSDSTEDREDGTLQLTAKGRRLSVRFVRHDLNKELDAALGDAPDLVTAAAFFDLASPDFIRRLAQAVTARRAVFYTVLTYNGIQHWTPRRPADNQMTAAFNRHQMTDKGFGASAGPTAPTHLADQFGIGGYSVQEGDSPWVLTSPRDAKLIAELADGHASAVAETGMVDQKTLSAWRETRHTGAETGHTDTLAVPT